jgi:hypothetical protein
VSLSLRGTTTELPLIAATHHDKRLRVNQRAVAGGQTFLALRQDDESKTARMREKTAQPPRGAALAPSAATMASRVGGPHTSLWRQAIGSDAPSLPIRAEDIAARAYAKYVSRPNWRSAVDHWLEAERELRCEMVARLRKDGEDS